MNLFALIISALSLASVWSQIVQVQAYTESLCPYCNQFLQEQVSYVINTTGMNQISNITLVPYGNAQQKQLSNGTWTFTCQHGVNECYGNLYEVCAIGNLAQYTAIQFIICVSKNLPTFQNNFDVAASQCAKIMQFNISNITTCVNGPLGNALQHQAAEITNSLQPPKTYVPWLVGNGQHTDALQDQIQDDLQGYICKTYKGPVVVPACKNAESEEYRRFIDKFRSNTNKCFSNDEIEQLQ